MLQEKEYHLKSVCPLMMHNGQLADPLNDFAVALKAISGKRKKTDADHEEMGRLEFLGGLYMGQNGHGLQPVVPAQNIRATLIHAARKRREGKQAEAGVFVLDPLYLEYDGPTDPDDLWEKGSPFVDRSIVSVQRNKVARTRPIFPHWEGKVNVTFDDEVLNESQLDEWFRIAGQIIGFCERRPMYGRFEVIE